MTLRKNMSDVVGGLESSMGGESSEVQHSRWSLGDLMT